MPKTGGRSRSHVPCPRSWLALRRGGSSGSGCRSPFFPRVLIHFVHLDDGIGKRLLEPGLGTKRLQLVATNQQPLAIHAHFPGQLGGRLAIRDAVQQLNNLDFVVMGPLPDRSRQQVETASAGLTTIIEDRGPIALVDEGLFEWVSIRTANAVRV